MFEYRILTIKNALQSRDFINKLRSVPVSKKSVYHNGTVLGEGPKHDIGALIDVQAKNISIKHPDILTTDVWDSVFNTNINTDDIKNIRSMCRTLMRIEYIREHITAVYDGDIRSIDALTFIDFILYLEDIKDILLVDKEYKHFNTYILGVNGLINT